MKTLNWKAYIAELIGTFVLVVFGCGTACAVECSTKNYAGYLITAIAFGLVIVAMAFSIGNISGCHINPAVSLAMLISGKLNIKDFVGYLVAQFCGGILGGWFLTYLFPGTGLGANGLFEKVYYGKSFLVEVLLTFVFLLAILGVTSKAKNAASAGIVIGLSLTLVHILGIYFTGTSVNPARSLGPAIFAGGDSLKIVWVFILAPFVGAALAALLWKLIGNKEEN